MRGKDEGIWQMQKWTKQLMESQEEKYIKIIQTKLVY